MQPLRQRTNRSWYISRKSKYDQRPNNGRLWNAQQWHENLISKQAVI